MFTRAIPNPTRRPCSTMCLERQKVPARDLSLLLFCFLWHLSVLHQLVVPGLSGVPPLRRCPRTVEAQQLSQASGSATSCCGTAQELPGG